MHIEKVFGREIAKTRIGVVGSGFLASGLVDHLENFSSLVPTAVLTRRDIQSVTRFPRPDLLTNVVEELVDRSDLVVECSGDVPYATEVVTVAMEAGLPVITMDAELHATTGSYFVDKGFISEAEGDQPGSLAALNEEAELMGFKPLVFGNIKWFLNHAPTLDEMQYWSSRLGISLSQVTSFTDGTKLQIEQALVANGLGADIIADGLVGMEAKDLTEGASALAALAEGRARPVSDYILAREAPSGVFIVGTHREEQASYLNYYKMGEGPFYVITRPYHLCHIELPKTIIRYLAGGSPLLNNSVRPRISVAAIAKRALLPGDKITRGIGGFDVRGEAIEWSKDRSHVPIGLLADAVVTQRIEPGQRVGFSDVELQDSLALKIWHEIRQRVLDDRPSEPVERARLSPVADEAQTS